MKKILLALSLPLICNGAIAQGLGERPSIHLQATRYVWTTSVDRETRQYRNALDGAARPGPVFLWLTVRGDQQALDWLRQSSSGAMPIYVFWMRRNLEGFYNDRADVVELSVGTKDSLDLLASQLAQEGAFSWRVWSGKSSARTGAWRVRIVDPWGGFLICPTPQDPEAECDLEIEVRE